MTFFDFIQRYFIDPVIHDLPYNIYNTTAYAIILVLAVWGIYHLLRKRNIRIDGRFIGSLVPFVLFGAAFRVWTDAGIVKSPFFITPGSYIVTAALVIASIFAGLFIQKRLKVPYHKVVFGVGSVLFLIALAGLRIVNWQGLLIIMGIFAVVAALTELVGRKYKIRPLYRLGFHAHMLDASATFTALQFYSSQYYEQHVLTGWVVNQFGPWSFFLLKAGIVLPVIYLIAKSDAEEDWKNLLMFAIIVLGAAPGIRNTLRLMMGV